MNNGHRRATSLAATLILSLFALAIDAGQCGEPPPCAEQPDTMSGYFDGVLYDEDLVGQTYAYVAELCINVGDDILHFTSTDDMQTYVMLEEINGVEVYVIAIANFKYTYEWDGGVEIMVYYDAALASYYSGNPITLDGVTAIGYYWEKGFWDSRVLPQYMTDSGEILFDMASRVPGGFVDANYNAHLVPYEEPSPSARLLPLGERRPLH